MKDLKNELEESETQLNQLEMASRGDKLKFFGIPETTNELLSAREQRILTFCRAVFHRNHGR